MFFKISNENHSKTVWEQSAFPTFQHEVRVHSALPSARPRARAVTGAAEHGRVISHFSRAKYPSEPTLSLTTVPRYLD